MFKVFIKLDWIKWLGGSLMVGAMCGCLSSKSQVSQTKVAFETIDSNVPSDPHIEGIVQGNKDRLGKEMTEVIGVAAMVLNNNSGRVESVLGNFVADLMFTQSTQRFGSPVDLALINARGGLRVPLSKGEITVGDVFELLPFDNDVWILKLTGEETQMLFDHCAEIKRMAISGGKYEIKETSAINIQIGGSEFDSTKSYILAIPDFLAKGGDGFEFLPQAKVLAKLNYLARDMIINHIRKLNQANVPIEARLDGRVIEQP